MKLTAKEYWDEYRRRALPADSSEITLIMQRQAFYYGCLSVHALLSTTILSLDEAEAKSLMVALDAELDAYMESIVPDNDRVLGMVLSALMDAQGGKIPDA